MLVAGFWVKVESDVHDVTVRLHDTTRSVLSLRTHGTGPARFRPKVPLCYHAGQGVKANTMRGIFFEGFFYVPARRAR